MELTDLVRHYDEVFNLTFLVLQSMKGQAMADYRLQDCEGLAHKIFIHAATIRYLRNGSNLYLDAYKDGAHIIDFPSIIVLARATFETFLNMYEVFFESLDDDVLEYRHATYQIEGLKIRENYLPRNPDPETMRKAEEAIKTLETIRERIKKTNTYKDRLDHNQRKSSLNGTICPSRKAPQIAQAAGFSKSFSEFIYAFQSDYTHGGALSVSQIAAASDDITKQTLMLMSSVLVMMVLSKLILNFQAKFTEARNVCFDYPHTMKLVEMLSSVAGEIDNSLGRATNIKSTPPNRRL
jgi:hypothetical protein